MASFTQMCGSFFDELSKIKLAKPSPFTQASVSFFEGGSSKKDEERKDREKDLDTHYDRPFSSLLTQDEEPTEEPNPNTFDLDEPEVVVRSGS